MTMMVCSVVCLQLPGMGWSDIYIALLSGQADVLHFIGTIFKKSSYIKNVQKAICVMTATK